MISSESVYKLLIDSGFINILKTHFNTSVFKLTNFSKCFKSLSPINDFGKEFLLKRFTERKQCEMQATHAKLRASRVLEGIRENSGAGLGEESCILN